MIKIIPKGNGFFENYDKVFGKKPERHYDEGTPIETIVNDTIRVEDKKELPHKCKCGGKYITKKDFAEFKLRLFNILLLERGMVLNVVRLMNQLAIADERVDTTERDPETLAVDIDISQQNIVNQFEDFDRFNEIIKEQLGIEEATDGDTSKEDTVR